MTTKIFVTPGHVSAARDAVLHVEDARQEEQLARHVKSYREERTFARQVVDDGVPWWIDLGEEGGSP